MGLSESLAAVGHCRPRLCARGFKREEGVDSVSYPQNHSFLSWDQEHRGPLHGCWQLALPQGHHLPGILLGPLGNQLFFLTPSDLTVDCTYQQGLIPAVYLECWKTL
jgi:hypothetical protein